MQPNNNLATQYPSTGIHGVHQTTASKGNRNRESPSGSTMYHVASCPKLPCLGLSLASIDSLYQYCFVTAVCEAKSEGLVRYPTTLAPVTDSKTVTTHCADNAHISFGSSLNVTCASNGRWSGLIPQCECDSGYVEVRQICQGWHNNIYFITLM